MAFKMYSSGNASSFWLGDDFDSSFNTDHGVDYTKLAATQRAIGNFVNIVTGKQIPVEHTGLGAGIAFTMPHWLMCPAILDEHGELGKYPRVRAVGELQHDTRSCAGEFGESRER